MLVAGSFDFSIQNIARVFSGLITNPFLIAGMLTFVISMVSHLLVLSRVELSFAYPFLSIAYVVVSIYSYFVFNEDLNLYRMAGIACICVGTLLISRS
jgi:EamA-like transporter family.